MNIFPILLDKSQENSDNALFQKTNTWFYNTSNKLDYIAVCSWGCMYTRRANKWQNYEKGRSFGYGPSTIKLRYNAHDGTVSQQIKGRNYENIYKMIKEEGCDYRLAMYLKEGAMMEVIEWTTKDAV